MIPLFDNLRPARFPIATLTIAVLCTVVFMWQQSLGDLNQVFILKYGFIPGALFGQGASASTGEIPAAATLVTYQFLHGGWMHLLGNLLYLWVFAGRIEGAMGHPRYVMFYLACGMLAAFAQGVPNPESAIPMVGASGAVSGILGAYLVLNPKAEITFAIPIFIIVDVVRLPAWIVLLSWFAIQLLLQATPGSDDAGIAFSAHIGGFIAGMALTPFLVPGFRRRFMRSQR